MSRRRDLFEKGVAVLAHTPSVQVVCIRGSRLPRESLSTPAMIGRDKVTRKSTSGELVLHGLCLVRFASQLQKVAALSSGVAALCEGMGGLKRFGKLVCQPRCSRHGLSSWVHLQIKELSTQDFAKHGRGTIGRVPRMFNSADALTNPCTQATLTQHFAHVGAVVRPASGSLGRGGSWCIHVHRWHMCT